jgi:lipoate-protein ligase B
MGVAVRSETTTHGAFLNVNPAMNLFHHVDTAIDGGSPSSRPTMSSLFAERRAAINMSCVRAAVIEGLASAFNARRHQIHALPAGLNDPCSATGEFCAHV